MENPPRMATTIKRSVIPTRRRRRRRRIRILTRIHATVTRTMSQSLRQLFQLAGEHPSWSIQQHPMTVDPDTRSVYPSVLHFIRKRNFRLTMMNIRILIDWSKIMMTPRRRIHVKRHHRIKFHHTMKMMIFDLLHYNSFTYNNSIIMMCLLMMIFDTNQVNYQ